MTPSELHAWVHKYALDNGVSEETAWNETLVAWARWAGRRS